MIKAPQDAAGGGLLIALGLVGVWEGAALASGSLGHVGPGLLPLALSVLSGMCGLILFAGAFRTKGSKLDRWSLRGPACVLGAAIAFGLAIKPLGLVIAGPMAVVLAALADRETRWTETLIFAVVMTVFCVGLFRYGLSLPIPIAPWLIGS
ncbi:MAG: tripartite tricarboxylate transporter TctB family protein [Rhodospirillales bacterium]|nr:tripartite tricarboxylate transporter TctB family protein [Rhodospirillales bacterium]